MLKTAPEKQFFKFVIPSMLTMLLSGLYTIVDGFFVGHAVGDVGLAGIGLAWPITAVLIAVGMGVGVGGSVVMSIFRGEANDKQADNARGNLFLVLLFAGIAITVILMLVYPAALRWLGAKGAVYDAAASYIHVIALGGSMQIFASGLIPVIRNSHKTVQAMLIMGCGLVVNIALDAYFLMVLNLGLGGAALATIIAQAVTVVLCLLCLLLGKSHPLKLDQLRPNPGFIKRMLLVGVSPFGLSLMPSLITLYNNWQCLKYGGDTAVAAYSVINYLLSSVLMLLEGIGEGMQPLISHCAGAKQYAAMRKIRNKGLATVLCFSAVFLLLCIPARTALPVLFGASGATAAVIHGALPILSLAFPMMGLGKLFTSYFYASGNSLYSTILVYADPIVITPALILLLPQLLQLQGVWLVLPCAQAVLMLLLAVMLRRHFRQLKMRSDIIA